MKNIIKTNCYFFLLFFTIIMFSFSCIREVKSEDTDEVTEAPVIQNNKTEQQNNLNCFTQKDIKKLNLFFKSISSGNTDLDISEFNFKKEDLSDFKKLFLSNDFDSFILKYDDDVECDDYIILDIMERIKYEDDGEIHYSERNIMYELIKRGKSIEVKSAGIAG